MKRIFIAFASCLVLASCVQRNNDAQQTSLTAAGNVGDKVAQAEAASTTSLPPTTVQMLDSLHDFGTVEDGAIVQYSYRFKNTGSKPLVISDATASCGCTVPEKPEQPVMPGETGFIKVKFDSKGRVGEAAKSITVTSNASPGFPELKLKGVVKATAGK